MWELGPLAFTQPWLLPALALLPAIWWLLRAIPPAPKRVVFAPLFILRRLVSPERTPARTPWWLLLLRMAIAALLILAMAGPVLNPRRELLPERPLLLVLDDGWAAAPRWEERLRTLDSLLAAAERRGLPVLLLRTAPGRDGTTLRRSDAAALRREVMDLLPSPWPVDRRAAMAALADLAPDSLQVAWLADGIVEDGDGGPIMGQFADQLRRLGPLQVFADPPAERAMLLLEPREAGEGLGIELLRPSSVGGASALAVLARGPAGEVLARVPVELPAGARAGSARLELPLEVANRIARLEVEGVAGAGTVVLFDERWRRRVVGLAGSFDEVESQPLLSELYFIRRALEPYAGIVEDRLERLVERPVSMIVLADVGRLSEGEVTALRAWVERGGVLLRFAGPKLAAGGDPLLPVELREGDRVLGGALSWSEPARFAPFPPEGPFAGLEPDPEVVVYRQVLAEPRPELAARTLATLADGTPIVTGRRLGQGWLVLVHTTANTSWSTLPLSRLFIDLMRRVASLAAGTGGTPEGLLDAERVLDGLGRLTAPPPDLVPLPASELARVRPGPKTPPGLWVPVEAARVAGSEAAGIALNLQDAVRDTIAVDMAALAPTVRSYVADRELALGHLLLLSALLLALLDTLIGFALRGLLRTKPAMATAVAVALSFPVSGHGEEDLGHRYAALLAETRLAYVRTGIPEVDRVSKAGLAGLGLVLARRTSVEPGEPVAVDLASDELALFPLLYWPVPPEHPELPEGTLERVDDYLQHGGMIVFDTGDAARLLPGEAGGGPGERRLAQLLRGLDLPPLVPVPPDHALTRAFYLLQDFPGRFTGQPVWVDEAPPGINDGVSRVVIGAHDWAGAWAVDDYGNPLLPVVPGGEGQREMARRFGVNLVMYALTGNYKTDQVHVPALLERLGQ
ncbi:hypothetical protein HRbin40_00270 [bacterium HR40]|nr:hypothetical protein HRbin40_00270 [bacterium HR40]